MSRPEPILCIDRQSGEVFEEKVAGAKALQFLYQNGLGSLLIEAFIKHKFISKLYGFYQDLPYSCRDIEPFIEEYKIDLSEAEKSLEEFSSFNDFFARKLKAGARPIDADPARAIVPGDGRVSVIPKIKEGRACQIKGVDFSIEELLQSDELKHKYNEGVLVIVRLCPVDYHRFHFPIEGIAGKCKVLGGNYYSVNPWAIRSFPSLFAKNYREFLEVRSTSFKDVLLMDVGATMVGKVHQTYRAQTSVFKGQERGYFEFGASTTLVLFQKGVIEIDEDLIQASQKGMEVLCKMGQSLGRSLL